MQGNPLPSVLVVEDDPQVAAVLTAALADSYAVDSAGDVPAALARLDGRQLDVVLLDCLLPGGRVADVLAKAQQLACAVVLMSGWPEVLTGMADLGHPCLPKPFRIAELLAALETARARARG